MKKALIISYYWPPAGGPGVHRVLNIVEHLPSFGWEPIVLTVENPSAPAKDDSLLARIPENCKVYKTKTREPFNTYKKLTGRQGTHLAKNITLESNISLKEKISRWIRANVFIPDARKGWKKFMVKEGLKIIEKEQPEIIFSTSPPHSLQLGAKTLAKKSGLPWVCDLRDPWTEAIWESKMPKTAYSRKRNVKLERNSLSSATRIITVGDGIKKMLEKKSETPVSAVFTGYREFNKEAVKIDKFEIIYLGNLSNMQYCETFYKALENLPASHRGKIRLSFIGDIALEHKERIKAINDIDVEYVASLPYDKMMERSNSSSMLLLPKIESVYSQWHITLKLFDYFALARPVIAIADKDSDIDGILDKTGNGKAFLKDEHMLMTEYILSSMNTWEEKGNTVIPPSEGLIRFSSAENVKLLAGIFNELR